MSPHEVPLPDEGRNVRAHDVEMRVRIPPSPGTAASKVKKFWHGEEHPSSIPRPHLYTRCGPLFEGYPEKAKADEVRILASSVPVGLRAGRRVSVIVDTQPWKNTTPGAERTLHPLESSRRHAGYDRAMRDEKTAKPPSPPRGARPA